MENLTCELGVGRSEREELAVPFTEFATLKMKQHKQLYLDSVQQCCMELMSLKVSTWNVEKVIRSVLHNISSMNVDSLPKPTMLVTEMKGLA